MGNSDIRRLDKEIRRTTNKLEAVQRGEWWPLTSRERLAMTRAMAQGARSIHRGNSTAGAEDRMDSIGSAVETRLNAELTALYGERQRLITEAARAKAAKKSSRWF
ncbi:hypothetical protein [Streptomyces viridochromogenes]|uniref:hypothetical protein n=1 Tax=Streptomyces viridochromogenes TaxID=1938 RepID=UPI00069E8EA0|nr:hypothetical protein [Streptomyces viridochromogenes]KOG19687.1 hypothetical protein ADK35_19540 [Streptomyces viridochromogenes]KOG22379.1 hypothetical protein ADK36_11125 [Streptomyces viridochromogenes]